MLSESYDVIVVGSDTGRDVVLAAEAQGLRMALRLGEHCLKHRAGEPECLEDKAINQRDRKPTFANG